MNAKPKLCKTLNLNQLNTISLQTCISELLSNAQINSKTNSYENFENSLPSLHFSQHENMPTSNNKTHERNNYTLIFEFQCSCYIHQRYFELKSGYLTCIIQSLDLIEKISISYTFDDIHLVVAGNNGQRKSQTICDTNSFYLHSSLSKSSPKHDGNNQDEIINGLEIEPVKNSSFYEDGNSIVKTNSIWTSVPKSAPIDIKCDETIPALQIKISTSSETYYRPNIDDVSVHINFIPHDEVAIQKQVVESYFFCEKLFWHQLP
jgi:hypothetical protein